MGKGSIFSFPKCMKKLCAMLFAEDSDKESFFFCILCDLKLLICWLQT